MGQLGLVGSYIQYMQDAVSFHLKEIHVFNASSFVRTIFSMVKPFIYKELRESIFLHSSQEKLAEFLDGELIPNEYGGTAGRLDEMYATALKKLEDNVQLLEDFNFAE